jgi:hypothetical protein
MTGRPYVLLASVGEHVWQGAPNQRFEAMRRATPELGCLAYSGTAPEELGIKAIHFTGGDEVAIRGAVCVEL